MGTFFSDIIQFFANLSTGGKIIWIVFAGIFLFSISIAVKTKGKEGGIAAGVVTGILVHSVFILKNKSLMKFADLFKYEEWYVVVGVLIGFFAAMVIFIVLMGISAPSNRNGSSRSFFFSILLRIIGIAGAAVTILFAFVLIGIGGIIFY